MTDSANKPQTCNALMPPTNVIQCGRPSGHDGDHHGFIHTWKAEAAPEPSRYPQRDIADQLERERHAATTEPSQPAPDLDDIAKRVQDFILDWTRDTSLKIVRQAPSINSIKSALASAICICGHGVYNHDSETRKWGTT